MNYELRVGEFSGPLEKLLELIEEKKLEISRISLGKVTADFLRYLESLEDVQPRILADFISVAGKLILIKSKTLLPNLELTEEEEEDIQDLERRLKLYEQFRELQQHLRLGWGSGKVSYSRPLFQNLPPVFCLSKNVTKKEIDTALSNLLETLQKESLKTESIKLTIISVEEKVKELVSRVEKEFEAGFSSISKDKPKEEIIALFLALLLLFKDNLIRITQTEHFSEIVISKNYVPHSKF